MSGHVIQCWSCGTRLTLGERNENDGDCLGCGVEIVLDDYLDQAMTERDELRAQVEAMRALLVDAHWTVHLPTTEHAIIPRCRCRKCVINRIDAALQEDKA